MWMWTSVWMRRKKTFFCTYEFILNKPKLNNSIECDWEDLLRMSESESPATSAGNLKNRVDKCLKLSIPSQASSIAKAPPATAPALSYGKNQFCDQFGDIGKISTSWSPKSFDNDDYFVSTPGSFNDLRKWKYTKLSLTYLHCRYLSIFSTYLFVDFFRAIALNLAILGITNVMWWKSEDFWTVFEGKLVSTLLQAG